MKRELNNLSPKHNLTRMGLKLDEIVNRSVSCDLRHLQKMEVSGREMEGRNKQMKSIKEYLKFAYNRNQK